MHIRKEVLIPTSVGVASFGVGAAVGYFVAVARFSKRVNSVIAEMEYLRADKEEFEVDPNQTTLEDLVVPYTSLSDDPDWNGRKIDELGLTHATPTGLIIDQEDFERRNLFPDTPENWDMEAELKIRESLPEGWAYVIHRGEFEEDEPGYTQTTLTYYAGDNVLVDDKDVPLTNIARIVGNDLTFGKGSGDPNVLYIRNDRLGAEYEILLDRGFFAIEVLGEEIERQLSAEKAQVPKFKSDD